MTDQREAAARPSPATPPAGGGVALLVGDLSRAIARTLEDQTGVMDRFTTYLDEALVIWKANSAGDDHALSVAAEVESIRLYWTNLRAALRDPAPLATDAGDVDFGEGAPNVDSEAWRDPAPLAAEDREPRDLPDRVVVGKNGAYWRDYGDHYSMCPVSEDNDPVEIVAIYNRSEADATAWDRGFAAGLRSAAGGGPVR